MPAPIQWMTAKDIKLELQVSLATAYNILNLFEARGQLFRYGNVRRVKRKVFDTWCAEQEALPAEKRVLRVV